MAPLTTVKLNEVLNHNNVTKSMYLGAFPSCIKPRTSRKKYSFISNTDDHNESGEHWCAWMVDGQSISFFDSLGREPWDPSFPPHFQKIVEDYSHLEYTQSRVQKWTSKTCGYFCIHFIFILSLGLDYRHFLDEYSSNFLQNDNVVLDFYNSISYSTSFICEQMKHTYLKTTQMP